MAVAIKRIPNKKSQNSTLKLTNSQAIFDIAHENIIKLYQTFICDNSIYIVMEYCETDLQQHMNKLKTFSEKEALKILKEVINGYK